MKKESKTATLFDRLKAGLEEGIRHARGEIELVTYVVNLPAPAPPVVASDLVALRNQLKLTESGFAHLMNVRLSTLHAWESGKRKPTGAAARLIQVYGACPDVVGLVANGKSLRNGKPTRTTA